MCIYIYMYVYVYVHVYECVFRTFSTWTRAATAAAAARAVQYACFHPRRARRSTPRFPIVTTR